MLAIAAAPGAHAYNYVPTANGEAWGVQDGAAPRVDTGSIRDTTSNSLRGFGGIRVRVSTNPLRNGELLRGFNLSFEPPERFATTTAVDFGGVAIARAVRFNRANNWGRWLDTFKNTTSQPIDVDVVFGGQTGIGSASGATNASVSETSSGDAVVGSDDTWALSRVGSGATAVAQGPSAVVIGSPTPFAGALMRTANFVRDPFNLAPTATGHEANFLGFQSTFTLAPGQTRTLARFVVIGTAESPTGTGTTAPGAQIAAVRTQAVSLAASPGFSDLTKGQICALVNWDVSTLTIPAFNAAADCPSAASPPMPPTAAPTPTTTGSDYNVVGKTIGEMRADMEAGRTTSQKITRAYLDRIAAYDVGPLGFNAYTTVAADAMAQAKAADAARAAGKQSPVLGIPLAIKDLYDSKDMPTTNGSLAFQGYRPPTDATQVRLLREAGAIIIGKASLEEYALSGQYSDSAYGQVWNAFQPSKSSLASSGGTAVATAASLAAGGLGSQTGDSLYAPASAASLWTLRGTDGMASTAGVMPLSWLQDYPGAITRSAGDLADILDVTTGTDPLDQVTVDADADAHRPAEWRSALSPNALQGKRIGYYASAFVDPFGTTGTTAVQLAALHYFTDAGATLVEIGGPPSLPVNPPGDKAFQGWVEWLKTHPNAPYDDPRQILGSQKRLPYRRSLNGYTGTGEMTPAQITAYKAYRANAKTAVAAWLDAPPTPVVPGTATPSPGALDAVVFPGLRSDISLNDGGSSAFGRGDPPTNSAGAPSVAFPIGYNDHGEPTNLQVVGRAFDDPKLLGYAYAFDQLAHGHVETDKAPALPFKADPTPPVITEPAPVVPITSPPAKGSAPAAAFSASATVARTLRITTARLKGVSVLFDVNRSAVLKAELRVSAATAARLHLPALLGSGSRGVIRSGRATVQVRLTRKASLALKRLGRVDAKIVATATGADGRKLTTTRAVTLKR